jgi:hypothetical protein
MMAMDFPRVFLGSFSQLGGIYGVSPKSLKNVHRRETSKGYKIHKPRTY